MKFFDYTGAIHLHSSFSFDGHAPMKKILSAAEKNGIHFLMLTDHDHLRAREEGWEGWQGKTLVIVGEEIAPRFNHYLAFNIQEPVLPANDPEGNHPQKYIDDVNKQGGFGFIAHPDHEGTKLFHVKHYCWNDWKVSGYAGISVWDFMTDWQKRMSGYLNGLLGFLFPAFFLKGPRRITLERWDALNQISKTVGIGELDNHATVKKIWGIPLIAFPFSLAFRFIRTHVLTQKSFSGDNAHDTHLIYTSLLHGRCYFALEYFRKASGFSFAIHQGKHDFFMGDTLAFSDNMQLSVSLPEIALVKVILNGREWICQLSSRLSARLQEPGIYRVEAYLKSFGRFRPWLFSNPIFVI